MLLEKYENFLTLSNKDSTNYLSVCGLNTSSRKVELVARAFPVFELKMNIIASSEELQKLKQYNNLWNKVFFQYQHKNFGITAKMVNLLSIIRRVQSPACTICPECH